MALKIGFAALALGTMLLGSSVAQADDKGVTDLTNQEAAKRRGGGYNDDRGHGGGYNDDRGHGGHGGYRPAPRPPPQARGRYEMQTVNRWVEGRNERVWVPEVCQERYHRRGRVTKCTGGFYENRWVPGRYEQVQEWVWVPYGNNGDWGSSRTHAASYVR